MKKVLSVSAFAAAAIACSATPGLAASGDCRVIRPATGASVCREDAWLHQGTSRLANLAASSETPSWNTTKPTAAFRDGGAAYLGLRAVDMLQSSPNVKPTFTGTYTGVLDNIAASFFISNPVYQKTGTDPVNFYSLTIDGKTLWTNGSADDEYPTPINAVDDHTGHIDFAFVGLYDALAAKGIANDATTTHKITLSLVNKYWGDGSFIMEYDSAEYPSGMAFNLEDDPLSSFTQMDATWEL